jgi:signal peptide peptidase SppA
MSSADPKYAHILQAVYSRPWAILPSTLELIVDIISFRASGGVLSEDEIQARVAGAQNGPRKGGGQSSTVAVIPVYGPISQRQNLMSASSGGTSVEGIAADFRAALADPAVDGIVFEFDSPGGTIDGIAELAAEIRDARGTKPIVAHANVLAASAAYWLASAADEIVATQTGVVGSIGVFTAHQDLSKAAEEAGVKTTLISYGKYKTEGNKWEPLSDDARQNLQDQVDQIGAMFEADLARNRSVPIDTIRKGYGQGRVLLAKPALAAGMVDRIDTLDNTIRRVARQAIAGRSQTSMAALDPELPFTARLELVSAAAAELVEHATARLDMRARQGRSLTSADRAGLLATADALRAIAGAEPDDDEPETEPDEAAPSTAWAKVAANRLALARAEYQFD